MGETMRKIGKAMAIRMGILMSFFLSLIGTLTSGHFTPVGFLLSFVVSSIVSLLIGVLVPIGKITTGASRKMNLKGGSFGALFVESFISDLIYTPIMTLIMVFLAYTMAMKMSGGQAGLNFLGMFLPSLGICFVAGLILIMIFQPIFFRSLMKKYNLGGPGMGPGPDGAGGPGPEGMNGDKE